MEIKILNETESESELTVEEMKKLLYDEKGKIFNDTEKLYHYTSFEAGCKILASKELLFGKLQNLNDINESFRQFFYDSEVFNIKDEFEKEFAKCRQISLTMDRPNKLGFLIPAMWGHYAQKGYGMCIVLDKQKIINQCKKNSFKYGAVNYKTDYSPEIIIEKTDAPQTVFKEKYKQIFFTKTIDWSYEQEYRIITYAHNGEQQKLNIKGAIVAAIICYSKTLKDSDDTCLNSAEYKAIKAIAVNNFPTVALGRWSDGYNLSEGDNFGWQEKL